MMSRTVGSLVAALGSLVLAACAGQTAPPPATTTNADSSATAPASSDGSSTGCRGVGLMPDLSGVPTAAFGAPLDVQTSDAGYQLQVDPAEESQHPDLPKGSDEEILVLMITVTATTG